MKSVWKDLSEKWILWGSIIQRWNRLVGAYFEKYLHTGLVHVLIEGTVEEEKKNAKGRERLEYRKQITLKEVYRCAEPGGWSKNCERFVWFWLIWSVTLFQLVGLSALSVRTTMFASYIGSNGLKIRYFCPSSRISIPDSCLCSIS